MEKHVLIIEDDRDLVDLIGIHLKDLGISFEKAYDGISGQDLAKAKAFDLIILDIMLPKLDGFEVCRGIREKNKTVPILMLTSKSEELDKILGLELGANDYITKPFSIRELMARIKANLRTMEAVKREVSGLETMGEIRIGDLYINFEKRKVLIGENTVDLTAKEFELLSYFVRHPGRSFSREQLLNEVWGYQFSGYDHTVNSHINRLRSKIELNPAEPRFIKTVWGVGYRFIEPEELEI